MAETQRESVPRNDADERDTATAFLRFARTCVLKKAEGLDQEQLRRVLVGSGTSILGLLQHLTDSETWWFGYHVAGTDTATEWDFSMEVALDRSPDEVMDAYRAAIRRSDAVIAGTSSLDTPTVRDIDGENLSLRWVIAHMTSETARHAGHADILREQIDGTTGR